MPKNQQPLTQLEKDIIRVGKKQPIKHCVICGAREGSSGDGQPRRFVHLEGNKWACNYCNNQRPGA
jgi:hypothetical protein